MKTKKVISILLAAIMMLSLGVPMSAFAEDGVVTGKLTPTFTFEYNDAKKEYTVEGCGKLFSDDFLNSYEDNIYYDGVLNEDQGKAIEKLIFKQGVTVIGAVPFNTFIGLKEVTIPATTKRILRRCFNSSNIETINFGGTPEQWKQIQIDGYNDGLKNATVNYNVSIAKSKGADTFKDNATGKRDLYYDGTYCILNYYTGEVKVYGKGMASAEYQISELYDINPMYSESESISTDVINSFDIQEGITRLGSIFRSNAASVKIPKSVKIINEWAFDSESLKDVYYAGNIAEWNNINIYDDYYLTHAKIHYASKVSAKDLKYKFSETNYVYDGKYHSPAVLVTDKYGRRLQGNTDYYIYKQSGEECGKYKVVFKLQGQYYGQKTMYYTISPKGTSISKINTSKGGFTAFWNTQKVQTNGYEVQYSTSSSFKSAKSVTLNKNTNYAKKVTGLKSNKKYYVRVRTFKNIKVNGKVQKVYSSWSKAKSAVTK